MRLLTKREQRNNFDLCIEKYVWKTLYICFRKQCGKIHEKEQQKYFQTNSTQKVFY